METGITGGTVTNTQVAVANRSRMVIELGPDNPIWGALYFGEHNYPLDNPAENVNNCSTTDSRLPCVPFPLQPECATDDPATQALASYFRNRIYPIRPLGGGGADVGFLGKTRVNMVAFGSVPASATLTFRVPTVDGEVQFLKNHQWTHVSYTNNWGCGGTGFRDHQIVALTEGQVEISISDLVVDGVPVDVGARCRTERPTKLELWGDYDRGGYSPLGGGDMGAEPGLMPQSFTLTDSPQYKDDAGRTFGPSQGLDVPPFTGCGTGGDDLSPLVSAMASGPDNPVRVRQKELVIFPTDLPYDDFTRCGLASCPLPAPELPELPPLPWENGETP
ncbi:hypothetical protein [uncultured Aeromicrobium sp.]|uniref:hypothetical protein n=1 Tax=uncultured Aeromicrobium sp. TaxID=337820 RepID=UPI0025E34F4B|nr:hypothetical protein [uncultured Aeromicrobium sp.]